jgi:hypothetical protein
MNEDDQMCLSLLLRDRAFMGLRGHSIKKIY